MKSFKRNKIFSWVGFAVLLGANGLALAQPPSQLWFRVLGSPHTDSYPMTGVATNGDILVSHGGSAVGDPAGDTYLHRLNNGGDTLWTRQIGEFGIDAIPKLASTNDNGCIIALWNESFSGDTCYPVRILKFDEWGDTLWTRVACPYYYSWPAAICQTSTGQYVIAIERYVPDPLTPFGFGLLWLDADGQVIRFRDYPDVDDVVDRVPWGMTLTPDDEIILCGDGADYTVSPPLNWPKPWIAKFSPEGDSLWQRVFPFGMTAWTVTQTYDNGSVICISKSGFEEQNIELIKVDSLGNTVWHRSYGSERIERGFDVIQTSDSGLLVLGDFPVTDSNYDCLVLKTNHLGDSLWSLTFGGDEHDVSNYSGLSETQDGGFVCANRSLSFGESLDILVTRFGPDGVPIGDWTVPAVPNRLSLSVYPNPFNSTTDITFELPRVSRAVLKVYDLLGREQVTLVDDVVQSGTTTVRWDAGEFASGIYFVRLAAGEEMVTRKVVLVR